MVAAYCGEAKPRRELFRLVALVLVAQVCALFFRSWIQITLVRNGVDVALAKNFSYLALPPMLLLLLYPIWITRSTELAANFRYKDLTLRIICIGIALGIALRLGIWGLLLARAGLGLHSYAADDTSLLIWFACPSLAVAGLHVLVASILTPVTEEIINRGMLASWLSRYGMASAILTSAFLFAIFHHPQGIIAAFIFGIYVGKLFLTSGSLWGPLIAHSVFNALILLDWYCLHVIWEPAELTPPIILSGVVGVFLAISAYAAASFLVSNNVTGRRPGDACS